MQRLSRFRLVLLFSIVCGAFLAIEPADADGICHYWSYEGCEAACSFQFDACGRTIPPTPSDECWDDYWACNHACTQTCAGGGGNPRVQ